MSTNNTNSWLRAQRKMDLVEIADKVGLKKYVKKPFSFHSWILSLPHCSFSKLHSAFFSAVRGFCAVGANPYALSSSRRAPARQHECRRVRVTTPRRSHHIVWLVQQCARKA